MTHHYSRLAANDNRPSAMTGAEFRTPAEHRAIVATCGTSQRPVMAWPTLSRLKSKPALGAALLAYAELTALHRSISVVDAGTEGEPGDLQELGVDRVSEITPSVRQLIAASFRVSFTVLPDGTEIRSHRPGGGPSSVTRHGVTTIRYGDLKFDGRGQLTGWLTAKGRWLQPREQLRGPKGGKAPLQDAAAARRYVANDNVPIAAGASFLGGITGSSGRTRRADIGEHLSDVEADRIAQRIRVREELPPLVIYALDMATGDFTAQQIGKALGYNGPSARRGGAKKVDEALQLFADLAA